MHLESLIMPLLSAEEWSALRLSLKVGVCSAVLCLPPAVVVGYLLARFRFPGKWLAEVLVDLPLVLPPVVTGYFLLVLFAPQGPAGRLLGLVGIKIVFTWLGAVLASAAVSFPLMVRAARLAFQAVDPRLEMAARSLGAGRLAAFFSVSLPLARRGLVAAWMIGFARSLGEFGATIMVASNFEGLTRTIPLAIYHVMEQQPGGAEAAWRLVALSILLAAGSLGVCEFLERRRPADVAA